MKPFKKRYSFNNNFSFENLSNFINSFGLMTHPMSNIQKNCIECPNIFFESNNILETHKNIFLSVPKDNLSNDDFTLNLLNNKKYIINPEKLYKEFNKKIPYSIVLFKNSLKIFVSIFNAFNEDIFNWDLEDFNLFTNENKIQLYNILKNENININETVNEFY